MIGIEKNELLAPKKKAEPKFYEMDGALRAYSNRSLLLAGVMSLVALVAVVGFFLVRMQPPTVIRVNDEGEAKVVSPYGTLRTRGRYTSLQCLVSSYEQDSRREGGRRGRMRIPFLRIERFRSEAVARPSTTRVRRRLRPTEGALSASAQPALCRRESGSDSPASRVSHNGETEEAGHAWVGQRGPERRPRHAVDPVRVYEAGSAEGGERRQQAPKERQRSDSLMKSPKAGNEQQDGDEQRRIAGTP